jgi:soluble lytic murein transglycosylase-like protein
MRRIFNPRLVIQFSLFVAFIAVSVGIFTVNKDGFAAIAYPPIPDSHYEFIGDAVDHCKLPKNKRGLIAALAWKESTFHPDARSGAGAVGILQVLPGTGKFAGDTYNIGGLNAATFTDPAIGYKLGTCYLHSLVTRLGEGNPNPWDDEKVLRAALVAYNAGPARGQSLLAGSYNGPTSSLSYAERILQASRVYNLDFAKYDQNQATKQVDALDQVRDIVWLLLKQESK